MNMYRISEYYFIIDELKEIAKGCLKLTKQHALNPAEELSFPSSVVEFMLGKILEIKVKVGDRVKKGVALVVLSALK
jgi:biotin carboxyl carrier protein